MAAPVPRTVSLSHSSMATRPMASSRIWTRFVPIPMLTASSSSLRLFLVTFASSMSMAMVRLLPTTAPTSVTVLPTGPSVSMPMPIGRASTSTSSFRVFRAPTSSTLPTAATFSRATIPSGCSTAGLAKARPTSIHVSLSRTRPTGRYLTSMSAMALTFASRT